ncbi:MAG: 5-demethoxyubiquinol-8 5-hydroxylase UbiM [Thalassolituus oleivorans]|uniref:5-demethoxyubiquinol-8 5-hydroxylase UbiM n=1 Tax=Thalassolituus oleivorans TaxID=187493 RepID=UPI001B63F22C|nr:5-demethoxyubiquinol-8 5-hydroxylase UbiM [Thalassolituus oleivorans]MBQ0728815.1 5-demethoxyubiquinol-8 5-hydroxylase UbiM [Thalassolituus oleivorans]MBQ0781589.1 5-demethoxyubiquinol-8 5-hydroxylase UbiM [Thalassolituus oleivorans]
MDYDIAIIGAGPSGLSFALSLRNSGLNIALIEKLSAETLAAPEYDGREIALTHLSKKLMQENGSWQHLDPSEISPLHHASVINGCSSYVLKFDPPASDSEPLGFLVSNHCIRRAIYQAVRQHPHISLIDHSQVNDVRTDENAGYIELDNGKVITASLIVAADTRFSNTRRQMGISAEFNDYGRSAILCAMEHTKAHQHTALECFLYGGTLAALPLNGRKSSIVITLDSSKSKELLNMNEAEFNKEVEQRLGNKLGAMKQIDKRFHYPLVGVHAKRFFTNRFALIGDAAVGMHPVTAHGFNLGLSGQDLLAQEIIGAKSSEFWRESVLKRYEQRHMPNTRLLYHGTNTIVGLFTSEHLPAKLLRTAILRISNNFPPLKHAIRHKLMNKEHPVARLPLL